MTDKDKTNDQSLDLVVSIESFDGVGRMRPHHGKVTSSVDGIMKMKPGTGKITTPSAPADTKSKKGN